MYANLVMFTLGSGTGAQAEKIADKFAEVHKQLKGFKGDTYIGDYEIGEYGSLTLWETVEDLKAATDILRPMLTEALSGIAKGPPTARVFQVYEPKA